MAGPARPMGVFGAAGLVLGLVVAGIFAAQYLLRPDPTWFLDEDGVLTIQHASLVPGTHVDVEVDRCDTLTCNAAEPWFGARIAPAANGTLRARLDPAPLDEDAWAGWRLFRTADGVLLAQSTVEPAHAPREARPLAWAAWPVGGLVYGALAGVVTHVVLRGASPLVLAPRAPAAPVAAPAQPRPQAVTRPSDARLAGRLLVYDVRTRLPVQGLRATSRDHATPILLKPTGTPGLYAFEHVAQDEMELRAPGYQTRTVAATPGQVDVALEPQRQESRIRVLGGRSGSALGNVPVEVVRGDEIVFRGRTDHVGDADLGTTELRDDDLVQTAIRTEGFADGRMRARQAGPDGVLELRVFYSYTPSPADQRRVEETIRRSDQAVAQWSGLDINLGAAFRFVAQRCRDPLDDPASWGPLLIRGPYAPRAWLDALAAGLLESANFAQSLMGDGIVQPLLRGLRPAEVLLTPPSRGEPDLDQWLSQPPAAFERGLAALVDEAKALRARLAAQPAHPMRTFLMRWVESIEAGIRQIPKDRLGASAIRLRLEAQVQAVRWMLNDPEWVQRRR